MAQYLMGLSERENRINDAGKSADYMRKAMGDDAAAQMGITDEQWQNLGARDKMDAAQGFQQKQTLAQLMAKTRMDTQQADEGDAAGNIAQNLVSNPDSPMWKNLPPGSADVLKGISGAGPMNPRVAASVLTPIIKQWMGQGATPQLGFQEDPVSGSRFATYGRELIPSGVNPDKAKPTTQMVDDGNGGQVTVLVNPKTGAGTALKTGGVTEADRFKAGAMSHAARLKDLAGQIPFTSDPTAKAALQQQYQQALQDQDDFLNGKSSVVPLPMANGKPDGTKLKSGMTYRTSRGPATWDGKQFTKVDQ